MKVSVVEFCLQYPARGPITEPPKQIETDVWHASHEPGTVNCCNKY